MATGFTAASKQDAEVVKDGSSRFAARPKGKIIEIGSAPTEGRGDYISYYTARFGGGKKKKADESDEGKKGGDDEVDNFASDSEDEEEFEERRLKETMYQKSHEQIGNVRKLARKASGASNKKGGLAHSTSRVKLPSSVEDARALKKKYGLHGKNEDYALFKKDQESKASYEVCKYTEAM